MNSGPHGVKARRRFRIDLEDTVELVRPTVTIQPDIRGEACSLAEALPLGELSEGFAKLSFTRLEGCVCFGAINRDARDFCEPVDEIFLVAMERSGYGL